MGRLSYTELAPHLANNIARIEMKIICDNYADRRLAEYLIRDILAYGPDVQVAKPAELRGMVAKRRKQAAAQTRAD